MTRFCYDCPAVLTGSRKQQRCPACAARAAREWNAAHMAARRARAKGQPPKPRYCRTCHVELTAAQYGLCPPCRSAYRATLRAVQALDRGAHVRDFTPAQIDARYERARYLKRIGAEQVG